MNDEELGLEDAGTLLQQYWLLRNACVDPRLSSAAKAVLPVIMEHLNRSTLEAFPGFDRIAKIAGVHRASVMRAVDALEAAGYIQVHRVERRANRYTFPAWPVGPEWPSPGSTGATSTDATSEQPTATNLVAPARASGSTSAPQLVAPVRPEPASNLLQPSYRANNKGRRLSAVERVEANIERARERDRERIAWINQQLRYGAIDEEQAREQLRALGRGGSKVESAAGF